ncbi:hypothetical protein [Bradyrhizobium sp.]|jgi:hypothetical protein|uniref:hypothetical protein n=1 Tax=Bradyrhizobium sp. TaxID=376 RepID=UPI002E09C851|nr:hypothetical protein [Bradyrhizobium sp.]
MVRKVVFAAVSCAAFLVGNPSIAAEYRPDEFLNLDLSKAVLSPRPLGPPGQFEPMRVEAKTDARSRAVHVDPAAPDARPKAVNAPKVAKTRIAHARTEKPRPPARTKVVRRHTNPLDAQASDTRIQVWPCRSGGICNWQR